MQAAKEKLNGRAKNVVAAVQPTEETQVEDAGPKAELLTITPPKIGVIAFTIRGNAPYVQHAFGAKAVATMKATQEAGSQGKKGRKREPKDFQECYLNAMHKSTEGWCGIPAMAFRNACVDACRLVGFRMTHAKLGVFVEADGYDIDGVTPLVRITKGEPRYFESTVRLATGVADIRARPMWVPGWEATVRMKFDQDMFSASDVANLLARVGLQVGVGEGRPNSKESCGQGWGTFDLVN